MPQPEADIRERPTLSANRRRSVIVWGAIAASVLVHLLAAGTAVLAPRLIQADTPPAEPGTVELLMEERKGTQAATAGDEARRASQEQADAQAAPQQAMPETRTQAEVATPSQDTGEQPQRPQPPAASAKQALVMDFSGTDSPSDAKVMDDRVVPATVDDRFRNRPPEYPDAAAARGQQGTVVVLIHVSENGVPRGVELLQSSGYKLLDDSAIRAVGKWHFRPAIRDGRAEPFDLPFSFAFEGKSQW